MEPHKEFTLDGRYCVECMREGVARHLAELQSGVYIAGLVDGILDSAREMTRFHPFSPPTGSFPDGFVRACNQLSEQVHRLDQKIAEIHQHHGGKTR